MAHTATSVTWEAEIKRIIVQGQSGQKVCKNLLSTNKSGMVVHACHHSHEGGIGGSILSNVSPRQKCEPLSEKITTAKRDGGMA
jgi:hypothetical protein